MVLERLCYREFVGETVGFRLGFLAHLFIPCFLKTGVPPVTLCFTLSLSLHRCLSYWLMNSLR
jgi:hypothetical protein